MEEERREAGLGGWFNGMDQRLLESWSGPNSNASKLQDQVRTTLLTTIGGHTLPNLVRVPDNSMTPAVLRLLMEGPLGLWQFLIWLELSPPEYSEYLLALHTIGSSHVLLQVGLYYEDLDGEYRGGVAEEEMEVEIEEINGGQDVFVEL